MSESNNELDRYFPLLGECALCCAGDARHRVIDAIAERFQAGESVTVLADDYELPEEAILAVMRTLPDQFVG